MNDGELPVPSARAAAPPRSRSQYHSPKAIMFVSQMTAPLTSRMFGSLVKGSVLMTA
jgi:hypothetical protein